MIPPLFLDVEVGKSDGKIYRLWFPLVILWPVLVVFLIVVLPLAAVAQMILSDKGIKPLSILIALLFLAAAFRGLVIDFRDGKEKNWSDIKIRFS